MIDREEAIRRGQQSRRAGNTKHPYAAVEHRVIDSPAYADLTFSAQALLVLLARQLTKDNNGHLQATYSYMRRFGFQSEHTLSRALKVLISHGMIYRTRSGGYQQGAAKYAVTWLPIAKKEGVFLRGFQPCAWRNWQPALEENPPPAKMQDANCNNGNRTTAPTAKSAVDAPGKSADIELMPCTVVVSASLNGSAAPAIPRLGPCSRHVAEPEAVDEDEFTRCRDDDPSAHWDSDRGEFVRPLKPKQSTVREDALSEVRLGLARMDKSQALEPAHRGRLSPEQQDDDKSVQVSVRKASTAIAYRPGLATVATREECDGLLTTRPPAKLRNSEGPDPVA